MPVVGSTDVEVADVAALTGDRRYFDAITKIWENVEGRKLYLTGGVGAPETQELHRMRFKHTLRVTTANARTGKYLSDCRMVVATKEGRVLVDATPEGPMMLAKLPAGYYWLRVTCDGRRQERVVLVVPEKYVTDSVFYWD